MRSVISKVLIFVLAVVGMSACHKNVPEAKFNVATYNLRQHNHHDSVQGDGWGRRYPVMAKLIQFHGFDIFGTQEGYRVQLEELKGELPGYDYIGIGRDDGKEEGEHSAIFYRTDMFEVLDHGDFWLSEHPDSPGLGWDAVCPRICTWGHFRHKPSGREFLFFNLHMDHVGTTARVESAKLVQQKMKEFGSELPTFLTGDFNVDQTHNSYKELAESGVLADSYNVADLVYALNGTFNSYYTTGFTDSRIDHIFVSPQVKVNKYGVLTDTYRSYEENDTIVPVDAPSEIELKGYRARTPSDHFPVKIEVEL